MPELRNIFESDPTPERHSAFDLDKLTQQFGQQRNTDWSVPEAFLCLLLSAAAADGQVSVEEQAEVFSLVRRSRALRSMNAGQLASANAVVNERLKTRVNGLQEACESLPIDMRLSAFGHCVDIILADGELVNVEADYLNRIASGLQLDPASAKHMMEALLIKNRF